MNKKLLSRLKQYIKDDRPQKLKSYAHKHHIDLPEVELKHNRNLLHYCCQHGSGYAMRYLIREKVDGCRVDDASETPLHLALNRAIRYEQTGRHEDATNCYRDMILPLIEKYPQLLGASSAGDVTCRQLLEQLVKIRGAAQDEDRHCSLSDNEDESATNQDLANESERLWRDKLADELQFEYSTTWGKYEQDFSVDYEETAETYDDWTERIRQQYYEKKQAQREAEYASSNRKKRKVENSADRETDKLEEERRRMQEIYEKNQKRDRELKHLKRKMKYETDYKALFEMKVKTILRYCDIPWPGGDKSEDDIMILLQGLEKGTSDYKKYLREQQIRWHPDKFLQRFGAHILQADKDKILKRVTELSQKLNKLSE